MRCRGLLLAVAPLALLACAAKPGRSSVPGKAPTICAADSASANGASASAKGASASANGASATNQPAARDAPPILVRGATVWTGAGQILADHDVLVSGGRIKAIARDIAPPRAARVIEAKGRHLTPGMIDPHSHLGVYPSPALSAHADGNEIARPASPGVRARDGLWPQDPGFSRALAAGVTTAQILPGSANLVGGRGMIIKLRPGRTPQEMRFAGAPQTIKMACGENPKRIYGKRGGPNTRMGNVARLRALFARAVAYQRARARYLRQLARWNKKRAAYCKKRAPSRADAPGKRPKQLKRDIGLETLAGVLDGTIKVHWHCYRADDMSNMLAVAREFGFRVQAFHHAVEAYKIRDVLARAGTATVTWVNWWGFKIEAYDAIPENAALVASAGALVSLHSDSAQVIQRFNIEAARAYYHGRAIGLAVPRARALDMVTSSAARVLGIAQHTGSITVGKMADLVLWSGDPLSVYSRVDEVLIDGRSVYARARGRRPSDFELAMVPRPAPLAPVAHDPMAQPALQRARRGWLDGWPKTKATPQKGAGVVAIVGARVYPLDGPPLDGATVVVRDGVISAVGKGLRAPAGAHLIDGRGKVLTPGLLAAGSTIGLVDIWLEPSARRDKLSGKHPPIRAELRAVDALDPASNVIGVARLAGFTSAVARLSGGLISGQAAAFDLASDAAVPRDAKSPVAMYASLGAAGARAAGSRARALSQLRAALDDARWIKRNGGRIDRGQHRKLVASARALRALVPVTDGKLPLVLAVDRAAEIVRALDFAKKQRIKLVLSGAAEAWRVADKIAAAKVPVLVELDANLPRSFDALGARWDNAARLHRAGVMVGFTSRGRAHHTRKLRQLAGIAVAHGLPYEAALAALTAVPAYAFGLGNKGMIRRGLRANLVLWSGDPLQTSTMTSAVIIGGRVMPLTSRQTMLRQRYRKLPVK